MKVCTACKTEKSLTEYHKDNRKKNGRVARCKKCVQAYKKKYTEENLEKIQEKRRTEYQANKKTVITRSKEWKANNPEKVKASSDRRKHIKAANHKKRYEAPEFREKARIKSKLWYEKNKQRAWDAVNKRAKERLQNDPDFRAAKSLRRMIEMVLIRTGEKKIKRAHDITGYSANELRKHIESQFQEGMSWNNRREWHIDHIKPIAQFLKEGIIDPSIINALSNLQPLWAHDNLVKSDNWEPKNVAV